MVTPSFELLRILVAVSESKNLVEAAKKVGLSQPAVTAKLQQLESEVALPLFVREGRRKILTAYGRNLCELTRSEIARFERGFESVNRSYLTARHLTLKVGCRAAVFEHFAEKLLFAGKIEFIPITSHEAVLKLLDHTIDLAISYERPDSGEIIAKKAFDSYSKLVVHRKLARKYLPKQGEGERLLRDKLFLTEAPALSYDNENQLLRDVARAAGLGMGDLSVRLVSSQDWRLLQSLVDKGWGYAIVPNYIESSSSEVLSIRIPSEVRKPLPFYALFHREFLRVPAFKEIAQGFR